MFSWYESYKQVIRSKHTILLRSFRFDLERAFFSQLLLHVLKRQPLCFYILSSIDTDTDSIDRYIDMDDQRMRELTR